MYDNFLIPQIVVGTLLVCQFKIAIRAGSIVGLLLGAQGIYWSLAFVAYPVYVAIMQPETDLELADERLLLPDYITGLAMPLWLVAFGQAVFLTVIVICTRRLKRNSPAMRGMAQLDNGIDLLRPIGLVFWIFGWVGRVSGVAGVGALESAFSTFGTVGGSLLIISVRDKKNRAISPTLALIVLAEFIWAFTFTSKSAMMVPLLALCVRWLLRDGQKEIGKRLIIIGSIALCGFLVLQPIKGVATAEKVSSVSVGPYSWIQGSMVSVLERFDGFSAMTDAYTIGPGNWISPAEFGKRVIIGIVPKGPVFRPEATTGELWAMEVKGKSVANISGTVSLASGATAEGYAFAGLLGIAIGNIVLALATVGIGYLFTTKRPLLMIFGGNFLFSTVLFEQGIIGLAANMNKSLQLTFAGWVLLMIFRRLVSNSQMPSKSDHVLLKSNNKIKLKQIESEK